MRKFRTVLPVICCVLSACASGGSSHVDAAASVEPKGAEPDAAPGSQEFPVFEITQSDTGLCLQDKQRYSWRVREAVEAQKAHAQLKQSYPEHAFVCVFADPSAEVDTLVSKHVASDILRTPADYSRPIQSERVDHRTRSTCNHLVREIYGPTEFGGYQCKRAFDDALTEDAFVCVPTPPPDQSRKEKRLLEQVNVLRERIQSNC